MTRNELLRPPADTEKKVPELGIAGSGKGQRPPETGEKATRLVHHAGAWGQVCAACPSGTKTLERDRSVLS